MAEWTLPVEVASWISRMASLLHRRLAWRLLPLLAGALFAQGRKTVASWLRGGQLSGDFRRAPGWRSAPTLPLHCVNAAAGRAAAARPVGVL